MRTVNKRAALNKLASVRLAINYVLRNRFMSKRADTIDFYLNQQAPQQQNSLGHPGVTQVDVSGSFRHPGGNLGDPYPQTDVADVPNWTASFLQAQNRTPGWIPQDTLDRAKKMDLMRWYVSNGTNTGINGKPFGINIPLNRDEFDNSAFSYPVTEEQKNSDAFRGNRRNGMAVSGKAPFLPTMGHESSHNWDQLNPNSKLNKFIQTFQGDPRRMFSAEGARGVYDYENEASFKTLPTQMQKMLRDNPTLLRSFNAYSKQLLTPALNTYKYNAEKQQGRENLSAALLRAKDTGIRNEAEIQRLSDNDDSIDKKLYAVEKELNTLEDNPGLVRYDNMMYSRLLDHARKNGYDPAAGWWNNRGLDFSNYRPEGITPMSPLWNYEKSPTLMGLSVPVSVREPIVARDRLSGYPEAPTNRNVASNIHDMHMSMNSKGRKTEDEATRAAANNIWKDMKLPGEMIYDIEH